MHNTPRVSVVIPAYNAERFLERTLNSVLAQTHPNLEVWVVDDGSRDSTADIARTFVHADERIHLLQQSNSGVAAARNMGIQHASGDYIAPLDADDIWLPDHLEQQLASFSRTPEDIAMVYAWSFLVDEEDRIMQGSHASKRQGDIYHALLCRNFIANGSAAMFRRNVLKKIGGYSTRLKNQRIQGCEDIDLYLRVAANHDVGVSPHFTVGYRQVGDSMSKNFHTMVQSFQHVLDTLQKEIRPFPNKLRRWSLRNLYAYFAHMAIVSGEPLESKLWRRKAFDIDPTMTLASHDFYVVGLSGFLANRKRSLRAGSQGRRCLLPSPSLCQVRWHARLRNNLPDRFLEKFRLTRLSFRPANRPAPATRFGARR